MHGKDTKTKQVVSIESYLTEYFKDSFKLSMIVKNIGKEKITNVGIMIYDNSQFINWGNKVFCERLKIAESINAQGSSDFEINVEGNLICKTISGKNFDFSLIDTWNEKNGDQKWIVCISYYIEDKNDLRYGPKPYIELFSQKLFHGHSNKIEFKRRIEGPCSITNAYIHS